EYFEINMSKLLELKNFHQKQRMRSRLKFRSWMRLFKGFNSHSEHDITRGLISSPKMITPLPSLENIQRPSGRNDSRLDSEYTLWFVLYSKLGDRVGLSAEHPRHPRP